MKLVDMVKPFRYKGLRQAKLLLSEILTLEYVCQFQDQNFIREFFHWEAFTVRYLPKQKCQVYVKSNLRYDVMEVIQSNPVSLLNS